MEEMERLLNEIQRTAEIALEHRNSKAFRNNLVTVALESIISKCKDALNLVVMMGQRIEGGSLCDTTT